MKRRPVMLFTGLFVLYALASVVHAGYSIPAFESSEEVSEEYELPQMFNVEVIEGRRMKLKALNDQNRPFCRARWMHNNRPIERTRCTPSYSELVCPSMTSQDAGRYDLWARDDSHGRQTRLLFSANVHVTKNVDQFQVDTVPSNTIVRESEPLGVQQFEEEDCFCSGVTARCSLATYLYRKRETYDLSKAESVQFEWTGWSEPVSFMKVPPSVWFGNIITAYGGYLRFPVTEACYTSRSKPCVLLTDKRNVTLGYNLPPQHDQRQVQVLMKPSSWYVVAAPTHLREHLERELSKFSFMSVLSNVNTVFVRGSAPGRTREENLLTLDTASLDDEGLGRVNTVEDCSCHPGYTGMSCERCESGYVRESNPNNPNGICISLLQLWRIHQQKYGWV
ncbi:laminin subunit alpha-1-like [Anopheles nili]|uniref:laminin subunit alpha-1-like n=1 Tax=Anopheles nili TaxID=185578 RepID=UPI00237A4F00|nr:laminin subunit alpha-1-like [Anopheles nili]